MSLVDSVKDAPILHVIQHAAASHCARLATLAMAVDILFAIQEMPIDHRLRLAAKLTAKQSRDDSPATIEDDHGKDIERGA